MSTVDTDISARSALRQRGERAWAIAHPGPISYGTDPGAPPRSTGLTRAERTPMEAEMLMGELSMPSVTAAAEGEDGVLHGTPASAGRVTGTARIIHSESPWQPDARPPERGCRTRATAKP